MLKINEYLKEDQSSIIKEKNAFNEKILKNEKEENKF
jgi:hypothetical protein